MSNFSKRLAECMSEHNLNAPKLAQELNISRSNVNRFLKMERTPNFSCFIKMLYFFNCSADYLLGLVDIHTEEILHPVPPFSERLRAMLKERNLTQAKLIKDLDVSSAVPFKWLSGKNSPSIESLIRLARYFECSVDYLIGRVR